ncbi:MAG: hypothetical protein ACUVUC_08700 [Thermoguttaceae bacterium]
MAEPTAANKETPPTAAEAPPAGPKPNWLLRVGALLFLAAVILAECLIAYAILSPSPSEATTAPGMSQEQPAEAAHGQPGPGAVRPENSEHPQAEQPDPALSWEVIDQEAPGATADQVEVDLGQFSVTSHQPAANVTMRIDFRLYGIIAAKNKEEFDKRLKASQQRFREQVLVTVRSAEGADLADPGLGLIKRQILEKTNALLDKPLLRSVIVSDFSYVEQ